MIGGSNAHAHAALLNSLLKSCVCIARYLRQPMEWVEALTMSDFNRWGAVLAEVLVEERGGTPDRETADPYQLMRGED